MGNFYSSLENEITGRCINISGKCGTNFSGEDTNVYSAYYSDKEYHGLSIWEVIADHQQAEEIVNNTAINRLQ